MTRPFRVARTDFIDVDWDLVRDRIIVCLQHFDFHNEAAKYTHAMQQSAPQGAYLFSMRLAAAALLRVLKLHPASAEYNIVGTYRQLLSVSTVEGVNFPGVPFLRDLGAEIDTALRRALGDRAPDLPIPEAEDQNDTPYRRIQLHAGGHLAAGP